MSGGQQSTRIQTVTVMLLLCDCKYFLLQGFFLTVRFPGGQFVFQQDMSEIRIVEEGFFSI